jgi:pyruvate dehydrogenase E2 component (dihydrolipoamide acetyltransferase)
MPDEQLIPLTPHRKGLLYNMRPHLMPPQASLTTWVDMSAAKDFRNEFSGPIRLTYTHLFVKAAALALHEQPEVNAIWTAKGILLLGVIRIGVALPVEGGMALVLIDNPQSKPLPLIAQEMLRQAEELRSRPPRFGVINRLPQIMATLILNYFKHYPPQVIRRNLNLGVSNFGQWGIDLTIPAITIGPAVVTPGRVADRAVAINGVLEVRPIVSLTLAYDCRVTDDLRVSRFLGRLKALLENPQVLS